MPPQKPIIVFVPGAWHTPSAFEFVYPLLHDAGYTTASVSLPSVGVSPGLPDFSQDVTAVRSTVGGLVEGKGEDVVVVMHSYGGIVGTEALRGLGKRQRSEEGKTGGVVRLVYIAAVVAKAGESIVTYVQDDDEIVVRPDAVLDNGDGTTSVLDGEARFYSDVDPELARRYQSDMKTQSVGCFLSPLTYEAYRDIPSAYLISKSDKAFGYKKQLRSAQQGGIELIETIDAGHSPFLSRPKDVAEFIRRAAGEIF